MLVVLLVVLFEEDVLAVEAAAALYFLAGSLPLGAAFLAKNENNVPCFRGPFFDDEDGAMVA